MNTSSSSRDLDPPRSSGGMGAGAVLAVLVHVLLVAALAWGVHWKSSTPDAVEAELWAAVPQVAAPRAVQPEPEPPPPPKPVPETPRAEPPPKETVNAQIAIEKAKREEALREEKRREQEKERQKEREKERPKPPPPKPEKPVEKKPDPAEKREKELAEQRKLKEQQEKIEAARQENLKRMLGQAGASGDSPGTAQQSAGPSPGYAGRIKAKIKPNIVFTEVINGNPVAEVEVHLAPDGRIISQKLVVSSGEKAWDEAVLRAVERTEMLPRDVDGRVPSAMVISFRPRD
jgi:colicin import membrane protein